MFYVLYCFTFLSLGYYPHITWIISNLTQHLVYNKVLIYWCFNLHKQTYLLYLNSFWVRNSKNAMFTVFVKRQESISHTNWRIMTKKTFFLFLLSLLINKMKPLLNSNKGDTVLLYNTVCTSSCVRRQLSYATLDGNMVRYIYILVTKL